jgi:phosphate transport system permease protein
LASHDSPVVSIIPSLRDKSLLSLGQNGSVHLDHMTSERHLVDLGRTGPFKIVALTPRAGGLIGLDANRRLTAWAIRNPHPEVSWKTLFGKVWYESYPKPDYVWQSSSASDDFEPKLSLVPLIFGTLKGTFYAMLLAAPLAVLGALYTSQFMRPGLRRFVKPAVEIMAAIPSVVLGFLAALWLAPRVESSVIGIFLCLGLIPAAILITLTFWQGIEGRPLAKRFGRGQEFLILIPVILAGAGAALWLGPLIESRYFHGSFSQWLFNSTGARYDQRNCVIIAFALGFAVIPIIFTIAEDALHNIPRSLTAASLALGASRWQTAWRVVLPSASPGIFAGIMIGLGRAVGETMIVLMATGNTPIMSASPFDGMRTMAANIAVEIPEAPFGGTLYRVLFLTAVLLFMLTFILNTAAEIVRQRLRKRYGQL